MKLRRLGLMALLLMTAVGCSGPQTGEGAARRVLDEAAAAMGGWEALWNVGTQRIVSQGSDWELNVLYPSFGRTKMLR